MYLRGGGEMVIKKAFTMENSVAKKVRLTNRGSDNCNNSLNPKVRVLQPKIASFC